jgi:hypothetical protein
LGYKRARANRPIGPKINPAAYPKARFFPLLSVIQVPITPNILAKAIANIRYSSIYSPSHIFAQKNFTGRAKKNQWNIFK